MRRLSLTLAPLVLALGLAGCVNLAPELQRPAAPVPAELPGGVAGTAAPLPGVSELLREPRLRQAVELALVNNRDWRVALLNVEKSRAQLRIADADRWPTISAALIGTRAPNTQGVQTNTWQGGLQLSSYEIDLLGRVRNASDAAAANLLATEAGTRASRLALVSQVATAWMTLAADTEQLRLARATLDTRSESLRLSRLREQVGAASALELNTAEGLSASAAASVAQLERQLAQDRNALALLIGQPVPESLMPPADVSLASADWLAPVPAGLSSQVLLTRPDVIQAEQSLAAANANIGVARAAMFPRFVLSGSAGQVSDTLSGLFNAGQFAYTVTGNLLLTLFDAGRNQANVRVAEVNREQAVASYERAVQTAYREVADALVAQQTWTRQVEAQQALLASEQSRSRLTQLRFDNGAASLTDRLDAERSLASAQQALVQVRLAEALNRLALYKALGGSEASGG